ncbi:MAG: methionine--tRNA ligase [Candidatus Schekmanbacteria bacterium]|nr:methionine--tRNA ligase [Candidatus Schekmanbacteria bacterium]
MKKKLITSALPYVNNIPHLGNIIGCVLSADVYARFCRLRGYETLFICGTDEYGTATENRAREEGVSPKEICDKYHAIHKAIYEAFAISFDVFGRTSAPKQTEIAQQIFHDLDRAGLITEASSQRVFCERDGIFLADRYVEGKCPFCQYEDARGDQCERCGKLLDPEALLEPRCKICGTRPVLRETSHLYLDLGKLEAPLKSWFEQAAVAGSWTHNAVTTTAGWFERGLSPRPITRDLTWGVSVPKAGYEHKVFYVWYDAPIGYISITAAARDDWMSWWQSPEDTELYQFMGKDNIPFHTVMFPGCLIGTGKPWTLLHHIDVTEYLNYENTKFSKSRNIGVFGEDVLETGIPIDLWRYYLLANRPERQDAAFLWSDFIEKTNAELIDNIGNLVNRTLVYLNRQFAGEIRDLPWSAEQERFVTEAIAGIAAVTAAMEAVEIRSALRAILALGNAGNRFFQSQEPWAVIKRDRDSAHATVSVLAYLLRALSIILYPFMPDTSERIWKMLAIAPPRWAYAPSFTGLDGHRIGAAEILFSKLDPELADGLRERFSGARRVGPAPHLRVGQVVALERHPNADKLYVAKVSLGNEERTVVAGLVGAVPESELRGRKVLIVANLKPAKLRGVSSQGMILAAEAGGVIDLFALGDAPVGAAVDLGLAPAEEIDIAQFQEAALAVENGVLVRRRRPCRLDGNAVRTTGVEHGKVR